MTTPSDKQTQPALQRCPFCSVVPSKTSTDWYFVRHERECLIAIVAQRDMFIRSDHIPMWETRVRVVDGVDEDQQLVERIRSLVKTAFITGHSHGPSADYQVQLKFRTLKESQRCQTLIDALVYPEHRASFIKQGVLEPFAATAPIAAPVGHTAECDVWIYPESKCNCGASQSPTIKAAEEKINGFRDLKQNWDSYNAAPICPEAIEIALRLAPLLPGWQPVPRSDGWIQFERGDDEIEICVGVPANEKETSSQAEDRDT